MSLQVVRNDGPTIEELTQQRDQAWRERDEAVAQVKVLDNLLKIVDAHRAPKIRKGRNVAAGNVRGWGLQLGGLAGAVVSLPDFMVAFDDAGGRALSDLNKFVNIYLILRYGLDQIEGDILELGTYRGGTALFIASLLKQWGRKSVVYGLDTFEGMPAVDEGIDMFRKGDLVASMEDLVSYRDQRGLTEYLVPVKGLFDQTLPKLDRKWALVHVDCDIYEPIRWSLPFMHPNLVPGSYVIFDYCLQGACLGALEAAE